MSFLKAKSVSLQILHQYSVPSNITPLYFLAQTLYALVKSSPLKCNFLRFLSAQVKICQIPHINFELTSQFLFNFASLFIVMTHNSHVNFRLIHFQLQTKGSHQSPNFQTFKCSGENWLNSSSHIWKHQSVFLQILYQS